MNDLDFTVVSTSSQMPFLRQIDFSPILDNHSSVLTNVCEQLDGHVEFHVSGFGQDKWPVTVSTDLPIFLEQIPFAIELARSMSGFEIDFYEQGIERRLDFEVGDSKFYASCYSGTDWIPSLKKQVFFKDEIIFHMKKPLVQFMNILQQASPEVFEHPWLLPWRKFV